MWDSDFKELGLESGASARDVRRAYAARLKSIDPEKDQDAFIRLRSAYESALALAEYGFRYQEPDEESEQPPAESAVSLEQSVKQNLETASTDVLAAPEPPAPSFSRADVVALTQPVLAAFVESPEGGREEMRFLAKRMRAESLELGFAVEDELIDQLFDWVESFEGGVEGARGAFLHLAEACEDYLGWQHLALAPTNRQQRINEIFRLRHSVLARSGTARAQAESSGGGSKEKESDTAWIRLLFFAFMIVLAIARHCPGQSRSSNPLPRNSPETSRPMDEQYLDVDNWIAQAGPGRPAGPVFLYDQAPRVIRLPAITEPSAPMTDTHRAILTGFAGLEIPVQARETICQTARNRIVVVDARNMRPLSSGSIVYVRLALRNPVTGEVFVLL